ncbi:MAG: serine/threonine protein kinase [Verrucomicrobia bacterium]|nr:serine/threonine protein kinase [Verrucomicrobiota bacterium]
MTACAYHPHSLLQALPAADARPATPSRPALRFAHYRVLEQADGSAQRLGEGSMGVTYRALDERLHLEVALKMIAPGRQSDPSVHALFLREARAAARVRHTNVASVLALDDTTEQPFYAMELIDGVTLEAFLRERGPLPLGLALSLAGQIARGLEAIHRQGLVHRDLKPANLMLVPHSGDGAPEWQVKIIDFGVACASGGAADEDGEFCGSVMYASPEQCRSLPNLDPRADLYALGCILWEMLTGRPPFRAECATKLMRCHVQAPLPLGELAAQPAWVVELLVALLSKDPAQRPGDAGRVARRVEAGAVGAEAPGSATAPSLPRPAARWFLIVLLLVHAAIAAGIVSYLRADEMAGDYAGHPARPTQHFPQP